MRYPFCENPKIYKVLGVPVKAYPCGKCRACKARKSNEKLITGVFAAAEFQQKGQFLTLTYNDEHKPNGLRHEDFQSFMKKLRQNTGVKDLKMFMAGEYGEEGEQHREHFHVLFFNHKFPIEEIEKAWTEPRKRGRKRAGEVDPYIPFGFVYDGTCTPEAMKYCSGYVAKGGYDPQSGKRPPYGRFSCNLPDNLSSKEVLKMCKTGKISYNGCTFLVPNVWRRRYHSLWKKYEELRSDNRLWYHYLHPKKELTPKYVSAIMDHKEMQHALKKAEKRAKRQRRIISQ